jgi:decaprenylphospho-beta-D-ribofuranose 2-oxidase
LADNGARPELLTGWGRTAATLSTLHSPDDRESVSELLRARPARGVIARGLGRSYGDAAQNAGGHSVRLAGLGLGVELDAERAVARVGAGVSIGELVEALVRHGFFVAVTPGTRHVTVGGAIAADVHGKNHHRDGGFCDHVLSLELLLPSGEVTTVTPDHDLFRATAGGMGLTGVVLEATLGVLPVETSRLRTDTERAEDLDELLALMRDGDHRYRYSVAWIDCAAGGARLGRGVLGRGDHARRGDLELGDDPLALPSQLRVTAPPGLPGGLIRPATIRAFNELWFRKSPRRALGRLESLDAFFWPLDRVADWNRLYGPRGLLQYQLVVPDEREDVLRDCLERLVVTGAVALGVLKRLGPGRGLLSFPIAGWTLAVDMPAAHAELAPLLDELDGLVAEGGGRLYLAKDSRMRPELLPAMYPELEHWRELRSGADPDGVMRSDLARRLSIE